MKILAMDSSGLVASVALVCDGTMIAEYTTNFKKTHSQTLLPMIDEIVKMTDISLKEIDAIAEFNQLKVLKAMQVLDSRGNPTLQVKVVLENGTEGKIF